ncbi:MAG: cbb3-type cytochrome c oxidase subunit II [Verrucomicrobiia bacterium]
MKNGFVVFLTSLVVLGGSWCGLVLAPTLQLGGEKQSTILNSSDLYPVGRPGQANQGLQVYRANGCAACHTEQVQQSGVACDVVLTSAGKNPAAATNAMASLKLSGLDKTAADDAVDKITAAGGKAEIHILATGPDITRGWGRRHSVAEDFLYDDPVQLGSIRIGPDLADVGARSPDANWQLLHLYAPQSVVKGSAMPPFRYLFRVQKIGRGPSPDALNLPKGFAPPPGYEVVPTARARELAAYLLSLHTDVPLHDAPFTQPIVVSKP